MCGLLAALLSSTAFGATRTWTGTASGNWSNAANWGGTLPVAGDDLVFPATGANQSTTNDLAAGLSFNSITLSGGAYTLAGNPIGIGAGGIQTTGGSSHTIALPLTLTTTQNWQLAASSGTTAVGPINLLGFALSVTDAAGVGLINGPVTGSGSITQNPGLALLFDGMNTTTAPLVTNDAAVGFFNDSTYPGSITANGNLGEVLIGKGASVGNVTVNGPLAEFFGGLTSSGPPNGTASTKNLTFRSAILYLEEINSTTDFNQVHVTGTVDLSGAILEVQSAGVPAGTQFKIIDNDGSDPVIGTFLGAPQGGTVTMAFGAGAQNFTIDYHGGDGNDVVLTAGSPVTTQTTTTVTTSTPTVGQPMTLTATVTPNTGSAIPSGTVTFLAITTTGPNIGATPIGTATLDASGVATLTATLPPTTDVIAAFYSGGNVFGGSEGDLTISLAGSIPVLDSRMLGLLALALAAAGALAIKRG